MFAVWEKPDIEKGSIATDGLKNLLVFTLVKVDVWHSHASVSFLFDSLSTVAASNSIHLIIT
jgi:hypothetical protein